MFALDPGTLFSRKAIVLGAANQDGGAHVDPNPDSRYLRMAYTQEFGILVGNSAEGEMRVPLYGYHIVALRQMAYELLNSPALTSLADQLNGRKNGERAAGDAQAFDSTKWA